MANCLRVPGVAWFVGEQVEVEVIVAGDWTREYRGIAVEAAPSISNRAAEGDDAAVCHCLRAVTLVRSVRDEI